MTGPYVARYVVADVTQNERWRIVDTRTNRTVSRHRTRAAAEKLARDLNRSESK